MFVWVLSDVTGVASQPSHLDGRGGERGRAEEAEARGRPPHRLGVQTGEALVLEFVADDRQGLGVRACQRVEAAEAEEQVLEAVPGMLLQPQHHVPHSWWQDSGAPANCTLCMVADDGQ